MNPVDTMINRVQLGWDEANLQTDYRFVGEDKVLRSVGVESARSVDSETS